MTLKRIQVVMLSTEKAENFTNQRQYPCILKHSWMFDKDEIGKLIFADCNIRTPTLLQHLYILSDDEIKDSDWIADKDGVYQFNNSSAKKFLSKGGYKKIIAATDSLVIESKIPDTIATEMYFDSSFSSKSLPRPSEDFIKVYVEEYNKGNIIKYVDVEYEEKYFKRWELDDGTKGEWEEISFESFNYNKTNPESLHHMWKGYKQESKFKINSKNEISIRKIKDTWTREEVEILVKDLAQLISNKHRFGDGIFDIDKWIEENL